MRVANRIAHHLFVTETLENRDQVGERFMESDDVDAAWSGEFGAQPVKQCVCDFMGDNVVRQAGEYKSAGKRYVSGILVCQVIAEAQLSSSLIIIGVGLLQSVRADDELSFSSTGPPGEMAAERFSERCIDVATNRIDHLLVKPRVGLGGGVAVGDENALIVQIGTSIMDFLRAVIVVDAEKFAGRPGIERLVRDVHQRDRRFQSRCRRIDRENAQRAKYRITSQAFVRRRRKPFNSWAKKIGFVEISARVRRSARRALQRYFAAALCLGGCRFSGRRDVGGVACHGSYDDFNF